MPKKVKVDLIEEHVVGIMNELAEVDVQDKIAILKDCLVFCRKTLDVQIRKKEMEAKALKKLYKESLFNEPVGFETVH